MPLFRKKPVVIEARQLTTNSATNISLWLHEAACEHRAYPTVPQISIDTLEGAMLATEGDWIIKGVSGEFYPCKPDIFTKTYEPA